MLNLPNSTSNNGNGREFKKAAAFINVYLPRSDGGKAKVDSLKLYADKAVHAQILKYMADAKAAGQNEQDALIALFNNVEIDFQLADGGSSAALELPTLAVVNG